MIELKQFETPSLSIEDFDLGEPDTGVVITNKSASQLAAGEVIMEDEPTLDGFRALRSELSTPQGRQGFIDRQEFRRTNIASSFQDTLADLVIDPDISDSEKLSLIEGVKSAPDNFKPSSLKLMAEESIAVSSSPDETQEDSDIRLEFVDFIDEAVAVKREVAAQINAANAERNPTLVSGAVDLAEILVPFSEWIDVNQLYQEVVGGDKWLMGQQRAALSEVWEKLPVDKRAEFASGIIEFIKQHDAVIFSDGNDLTALHNLSIAVGEQDYSNGERLFDNAISVLEATGLLAVVGRGLKGAKAALGAGKAAKVATETTDASVVAGRIVRSDVNPASPSQVVKETNPEMARTMHETVVASEGDEAAEALYGSSKTEGVAKDITPEAGLKEGEIENKVVLSVGDDVIEEPTDITRIRETSGRTFLSAEEEARATNKVVRDLARVEGMKPVLEATTIASNVDGSTTIKMMYRPVDVGFKSDVDALTKAKHAFRHYGLEEEHLTLYRRAGDVWKETTPKLLKARADLRASFVKKGEKIPASLKDIDYAVGLNYKYTFRPEDLKDYDLLSTGKIFGIIPTNILDRLPPIGLGAKAGQGSLTQNFLDAASVLHPQIVEPALVAADKSVALKKAYVRQFEGFIKGYKALRKERRALVSDYIHKANFEGIKFNEVSLRAQGFNSAEIETLRVWRRANDVMFVAMNNDMAKTLRNKGFKVFIDNHNDTRLIVKPIKQGSASSRTEFYNSATGKIETFDSKAQLDLFYEEGGTLAKLSEPVEVGGSTVDVIQVNNKADSNYLKAITDNERVLNYREGYYPVLYDANFFIFKKLKKADGTTFEKVVGSAKNKKEAREAVELLKADDPKALDIDFRPDRRADQERASSFDQAGWDLSVNSGMSAQKVRGERLGDATGGFHKNGTSNLLDPLEAVSRQISTLSDRVSFRDYLDTTKKRWIENYGKALGLEPDVTGNIRFPSSITQVTGKSSTKQQTIADARSLFNHIYSLENGYINGIDEGFKAVFNMTADLMSEMKWGKGEEVLRDWGKGSMTSTVKSTVFKMYLAANPLRQVIVQAHQSVQLGALNAKYIAKGDLAWDMYRIKRAQMGFKGDKEANTMLRQLQDSGMLDAVDQNNLVRQDTLRLADLTVGQKVKTAANLPLAISQRVGFDVGERAVLVTSWLAHRDLAVKADKALTARELDDIAGKARAFTFAMNRAGDMPYNQNSLNIIAQFLQVPHKAMLQPFTNRNLSPANRLKLLTWNTLLYGVPAGITATMMDRAFEPGPVVDAMKDGLEQVLLNEVASAVTGEHQSIAWGDSLTPSNVTGMSEFLLGLWTTNGGKMLVESPAGSLLVGPNPRMRDFLTTAARWVHLKDDYDDPELDTKFTDVAAAFANLSSGWSNAFKAVYAFKTGRKISGSGNITDTDVTKFEAVMVALGFSTTDEVGTRRINEELFKGRVFTDSDVGLWYKELKRQLAREGMTVKDRDIAQRILTEGQRVFGEDPVKFQESLFNLIKNDVENEGFNVFKLVMQQMGWKSKSELLNLADNLPDGREKDLLIQSIKNLGDNN